MSYELKKNISRNPSADGRKVIKPQRAQKKENKM